jgi:hypothetical protein
MASPNGGCCGTATRSLISHKERNRTGVQGRTGTYRSDDCTGAGGSLLPYAGDQFSPDIKLTNHWVERSIGTMITRQNYNSRKNRRQYNVTTAIVFSWHMLPIIDHWKFHTASWHNLPIQGICRNQHQRFPVTGWHNLPIPSRHPKSLLTNTRDIRKLTSKIPLTIMRSLIIK